MLKDNGSYIEGILVSQYPMKFLGKKLVEVKDEFPHRDLGHYFFE